MTLPEDVARWARIKAAEENSSVSRFLGEILRDRMRQESDYQTAMERYLSQSPRELRQPGDRYPTREEIHDRALLR